MSEINGHREVDRSAPNFAGAVQPSYAQTLFWGPDGLRPGWGIAIYVAMFYPLYLISVKLAWSRNFGASGLWSGLFEELGTLVAALIPSLILARIERRPWGSYGLPREWAFGKFFWLGGLWGGVAVTLLMLSLHGMSAFTFGPLALHGMRVLKFAAFWAAMFLFVGLCEEFQFRGYMQFTLGRGIGFWPSACLLSVFFAALHLGNTGESWGGALGAACIGLFFCFTLRRTNSLWFAVGFHTVWDWGETFVYSVPDSGTVWPGHLLRSSMHGPVWLSGGTAGPEGSVVCFAVIALTWFAFDKVYPRIRVAPTDI